MQYVYAALLLHSAGHKIEESSMKKVLEASGAKVEETKLKAMVASLEGINIDEAMAKAAMPVASAAPAGKAEVKEEHKEEDTAKKAEEAAAGLAGLFG